MPALGNTLFGIGSEIGNEMGRLEDVFKREG